MYILSLVSFLIFIQLTNASAGDSSPYYTNCVAKCGNLNCTRDGLEFTLDALQPTYLKLLQWTCADECKYECMWRTVDAFLRRNWQVPQFYGKWPFVRILGIQEPASVIFSMMNFYGHFVMMRRFRKEVRPDSPLYWQWHIYSAVCLHAWLWSAIFHSRDLPFTEFMDYSCAFSIIIMNCYAMVARITFNGPRFVSIILAMIFLTFFGNHVAYLSSGRFDYGYNMQLNVIMGTFTAMGWFFWSTWNKKRQPYVIKCAIFVSLSGLAMLLEIIDFPPFFWTFDSHSLWHLSTAFIVYFFYSFIIDDCKYLRNKTEFLTKKDK